MSAFTRPRLAAAVIVVAFVGGGLVAGCTAGAPPSHTGPTPASLTDVRPLGAGYLGSDPSPSPEATVSPEPGSWDGVVPPEGYRVVLITADDAAATETITASVRRWAKAGAIDLDVVDAAHDDEVEQRIDDSVEQQPDLVIGTGEGVVDVFTLITPQYLDQRFMMIGVELPEPTANVSSVIWPGAAYRGSGVGTSGDIDPASFTPQRADEAVAAGVAGVLHGLGGIVVSLP